MEIVFYKVDQAAQIIGISARTIQERCLKDGIKKQFNRYQITTQNLLDWGATPLDIKEFNLQRARSNEITAAQSDAVKQELLKAQSEKEEIIIQEFTQSQYEKLQKIIVDYDRIKSELSQTEQRFKEHLADIKSERDYLRNSLESTRQQMQKVIDIVTQRNYIEAKEKNID